MSEYKMCFWVFYFFLNIVFFIVYLFYVWLEDWIDIVESDFEFFLCLKIEMTGRILFLIYHYKMWIIPKCDFSLKDYKLNAVLKVIL